MCLPKAAAFTWSRNSRDYQLTPWTNDPVINRPGEAHLRDAIWTAVRCCRPMRPCRASPKVQFETRHGLGYSVFTSEQDGMEIEVDADGRTANGAGQVSAPARPTTRLRRSPQPRLYGYAEWVLGNNPHKTSAVHPVASLDEASGALLATNPYSIDYSGRTAFLAASEMPASFTASRREFIGRDGSDPAPKAVVSTAPSSPTPSMPTAIPARRSPST